MHRHRISPSMDEQPGLVARAAIRLTAWTERWIPDAFIFALLATFIVFAAALIWTPSSFAQVIDAWGNGFWDLIDRKSTRLNSSHGYISYAVFCLKKKKK